MGWAVAGLVLVALLIITATLREGRHSPASVLFFFAVLGFSLLPAHAALWGTKMLSAPVYGAYRATIDRVISRAPDGQRVVLKDISALSGRDPDIRRARLFVRSGPTLQPGMLIEGPIRFDTVPGPAYPGGYDAQFASFFDGIGAYATSTRAPRVIRSASPDAITKLHVVRDAIGERIAQTGRSIEGAILKALVIGDQSGIDDGTRQTLATAGLAHVLAISGLHLSLVAGGIYFVVRLVLAGAYGISQRLPVKKLAALAGIAAGLGYLAISGGSVSALRATLTLILVFGAVLAGRRALTMRNVALAALAILLVSPQSLFRAGFQLSFSAVVALVGVYELGRSRRVGEPGGPVRAFDYVKGLALTSFVAGSATAVFAAYHFQQTAPLGVLGNVLAVPIVGLVILPAAAIGVLLMPLGLEGVFLRIAEWGIGRVIEIARLVAHLSAPFEMHPLFSVVSILVAFAALAWFAFFNSGIRYIAPAIALPAILLFGRAEAPDLMIADRTQAVAVVAGRDYALLAGRKNSFVVRVWEDLLGKTIVQRSPAVSCSDNICANADVSGGKVVVVGRKGTLGAACPSADLVVSRFAAGKCAKATVITQNWLDRSGVVFGYWDPRLQRFALKSAIGDPQRPWRPSAD